MSSDKSDLPADRSPEELAAGQADRAAKRAGATWRPAGDPTPGGWSVPAADGDPLTQLDREVADVEENASAPRVIPPADRAGGEPPQPPPLDRLGSVPRAWATLRADRRSPALQSARAKRLAGVVAAARGFRRHKD